MAEDDDQPNAQDRIDVAGLILRLRQIGITDHRLVGAIESVPRRLFVPHFARAEAYAERALPIDCGQTISSPEIVGMMTLALDIGPKDRVLEIGTGSGYQTAILARLARRVYTIDRFRTLVEAASSRFRTLRLTNISMMVGDGSMGWPEEAPFDRIIVTAAAPEVPEPLTTQLRPGGILVMPVGPIDGIQQLTRFERQDGGFAQRVLADVRFVPLIPGKAERL